MAQASARRSFHGPLLVTSGFPKPHPRSEPFSPVPAPAFASSLGRTFRMEAREDAPTTNERARLLAGVLAALRHLTSGRR